MYDCMTTFGSFIRATTYTSPSQNYDFFFFFFFICRIIRPREALLSPVTDAESKGPGSQRGHHINRISTCIGLVASFLLYIYTCTYPRLIIEGEDTFHCLSAIYMLVLVSRT